MCLGIPMRIVEKNGDSAIVAQGGTRRRIDVTLVKKAGIGDYVIVHAGFAIEKLNEKRAKETLNILNEIRP